MKFPSKLHRIAWVARKEVIHLQRDPRSLLLALGMPVLLTLLFGWVLRLDVRGSEVAVVQPDPTPESRNLVETLRHTKEIRKIHILHPEKARQWMHTGKIQGVIWIPPRWNAHSDEVLGLWVDGRDPLKAKTLLRMMEEILRQMDPHRGQFLGSFFEVKIWYNPEMKSQIAIIPGLIALILLLVASLQPAVALAREFERHTVDPLRLTPLTVGELLVGKLFPYLLLGYVEVFTVLGIALWIFDVPMQGSWADLFLFISLFLLTAVALGIVFSAITKNQQAAMQLTWLTTFLPSFFLSGFVFPLRSMPTVLQWISYAVPARYFVYALRGVMLKGAGIRDLWQEGVGLGLLTLLWMVLAAIQIRRHAW